MLYEYTCLTPRCSWTCIESKAFIRYLFWMIEPTSIRYILPLTHCYVIHTVQIRLLHFYFRYKMNSWFTCMYVFVWKWECLCVYLQTDAFLFMHCYCCSSDTFDSHLELHISIFYFSSSSSIFYLPPRKGEVEREHKRPKAVDK